MSFFIKKGDIPGESLVLFPFAQKVGSGRKQSDPVVKKEKGKFVNGLTFMAFSYIIGVKMGLV